MTRELELYNQWVDALSDFPQYAEELEELKGNPEEIKDRFYRELTFGTAGLRGVLGLGTNRMNPFVVGKATQGLAQYLLSQKEQPRAVVCYDSRNFSPLFAEHTATIFAANGIQTYLFPELAPTPTLAYATRALGCDCGVMITASHNPAEYNGYKVFNNEGCQIDDRVAKEIFQQMEQVELFGTSSKGVKKINLDDGLKEESILYVSPDVMESFCDATFAQALQPEICQQADLNITYTPLNGTGNIYVQDMFGRLRITNYALVPEQEYPDGNFPTAPYPNPEFPEALELGLQLAKKRESDLLLATDPDADRVAIAVRHEGTYQILSGNELGILLLDYIATTRESMNTLPERPVAMRSIVSSKMFDRVAASHGIEVEDVLTGFKHIGEQMIALEKQGEEDRFLFGYEEAAGYLVGHHVRDKDAIVASVLICEMVAYQKLQGKTLIHRLEELHNIHGYYSETTLHLSFPGAQGMTKMATIMETLREHPPTDLAGTKIISYLDYQKQIKYEGGTETPLPHNVSDVVEYRLEDDSTVIIRPSGTEPKLKVYHSVRGATKEEAEKLEEKYTAASKAFIEN